MSCANPSTVSSELPATRSLTSTAKLRFPFGQVKISHFSGVDRGSVGQLSHRRDAKLQLTVTLAPDDPVAALYLHPDHCRRRLDAVKTHLDVE